MYGMREVEVVEEDDDGWEACELELELVVDAAEPLVVVLLPLV